MSHDMPYRCVGSTARVFGVIARSTASGQSVNVAGSMSANTGFRPATRAISGTTQNVSAGTMISEPGGRVHRLEDEIERHPPVLGRAGSHVTRPEQARELLLEGLDVRALDELLALAALLDDLRQFRNHPSAKPCDSGHRCFLTHAGSVLTIGRPGTTVARLALLRSPGPKANRQLSDHGCQCQPLSVTKRVAPRARCRWEEDEGGRDRRA